jgi:hypothetical protein
MRSAAAASAVQALAAVLLGNGVYFLLLFPQLPATWQHQPFALDRGLVLDFALCLGFFLLVHRLATRRRHRQK